MGAIPEDPAVGEPAATLLPIYSASERSSTEGGRRVRIRPVCKRNACECRRRRRGKGIGVRSASNNTRVRLRARSICIRSLQGLCVLATRPVTDRTGQRQSLQEHPALLRWATVSPRAAYCCSVV